MNLRRWITALAVLAVFTAVAGAQVVSPTPISCSVSAVSTPTIRSEGLYEHVGDIWIICTGGPQPSATAPVDRATITVNYGVPVTSRVDTAANPNTSSEALLSIDEPNTITANPIPVKGFGQNAPVAICSAPNATTANAACNTYAQQVTTAGAVVAVSSPGYWVMVNTNATEAPATDLSAGFNAPTIYQGVNGTSSNSINQISFSDVPVLAPYTQSVTRVYRILNARVNATGATGSITATVTVTPVAGALTTLSLTNSSAVVANVQSSLSTSVSQVSGLSLCAAAQLIPQPGQLKANAALLSFKENVNNAFKTRILPLNTSPDPGDAVGAVPNAAYDNVTGAYTVNKVNYSEFNSESGFVAPAVGGITPGLADYGTRFKAVFSNIPANVTLYVSVNNVTDYQTLATQPSNGGAGDDSAISYAVLQAIPAKGNVENATYTPTGLAVSNGNNIIPVVPLTISKGGAEAVWEVTNDQPATAETFVFAVYAVFSLQTPPTAGASATVSLGYAPTTLTGNNAITSIPQFAAPSAAAASFLSIAPCQTTLLFPYLTNYATNATQHWETGVSIANTGADPFGSVLAGNTGGTCNLNFYGTNAPPIITTPAVAPGTQYNFVVSDPANTGRAQYPSFQGYLFAVCNFQFAHGFAFVEDGSPQGNAMGYLALVVDNRAAIQRSADLTGEDLGN